MECFNKENRLVVITLMMLAAFGPISLELYLPAIHQVAHSLSTTVWRAQLTISLFPLGYGLAQLFYGPLSDKYGRKRILFMGIGLYIAASLGCLFAENVFFLIAARVLQAVGACSGPMMARAIVRDSYDPAMSAKVLGITAAIMGFAPAVSPIFGGYMAFLLGWRSTFIFMIVFVSCVLWLMILFLKETNQFQHSHKIRVTYLLKNYIAVFMDKDFASSSAVMALFFGGFFAFITESPIIFKQILGISSQHFGIYFASIMLAYALGSFSASRMVKRFSIYITIKYAVLIGFTSGAAFFLFYLSHTDNIVLFFTPVCLYAYSTGMVLPSSIAAAMKNMDKSAGVSSGLIGFLQMLASSVMALLVSYFYTNNLLSVTICLLLVGLISVIISFSSKLYSFS